jgi:archaellum component FlaC
MSNQYNEWTDDNEHTLDMIRLNSVNLSERHLAKYQQYRKRLNYVKYPVILVSAANAYVALGLPRYVDQQYISLANSIVSFAIVFIVIVDMLMGTQKKIEGELLKFMEFKNIGKQIYEVLSLDRLERKIDPKLFLQMNFKSYEELTDKSDWIQQFKEAVLSQPDTFLAKPSLNLEHNNIIQKLYDDWNILFQPKLYKLKQQNANIFKQLPMKEIQSIVEDVKEEIPSDFNISDFYSKPFHNPFSYDFYLNPFMKAKTKLDTPTLSTDENTENVNVEHKSNDIESNAQKPEMVSSEVKSEKKFSMNFLSKN